MSQRRYLTLIGLTLVGIAFLLVQLSNLSNRSNGTKNNLSNMLPDFIIEDLHSRQFDLEGRLQYEMEAKKLVHYPIKDVTELEYPSMDFQSSSQGKWTAKSKRGFVAAEGNIVELSGQVTLERLAENLATNNSRQRAPITMNTDTLFIHLDKMFAETTRPVTISSANTTIEAIGMQADFAKNHLVLVSGVRGKHEISQNQ